MIEGLLGGVLEVQQDGVHARGRGALGDGVGYTTGRHEGRKEQEERGETSGEH